MVAFSGVFIGLSKLFLELLAFPDWPARHPILDAVPGANDEELARAFNISEVSPVI